MIDIVSIVLGGLFGFSLTELSHHIGRFYIKVYSSRSDFNNMIENISSQSFIPFSNEYEFYYTISLSIKSTYKYEKHITDIQIEVEGLDTKPYFFRKGIYFISPYNLKQHLIIPSKGFLSEEFSIIIDNRIYKLCLENRDIYLSFRLENNKKKRVKVNTSGFLSFQEIMTKINRVP